VSDPAALAVLEAIVDRSRVAERIEALLPVGVRPRQLGTRTLLVGILLALTDHRPAHLTRVHQALTGLPDADRIRLGVLADWKSGRHLLTYRQLERTHGLVVAALARDPPDGCPSPILAGLSDDLLEASIPAEFQDTSTALAVDWTDLETFSRPPPRNGRECADPEASWGHRSGGGPGQRSELFYGYYLQAATMVATEQGPPVPELVRRMTLTSCHHDPARALVPVLARLAGTGVALGDVLADSGYAHRAASHWAVPLRAAGASLVQDLHPADRGPKGTYAGAIVANGNLYCPAAPRALLELGPLARDAGREQVAAHDRQSAEAARYKLGRITGDDPDGYHRVMCPAVMGKLRCPLRPESMALDRQRPEILVPPQHRPASCTQQTLTVPPEVHAKTAQKHDYPSAAHRRSYARRTAAERTFATAKDPASNDLRRGWCRLMGLAALTLFTACLLVVRNQRVLTAFAARQALAARSPASRRRRRKPLASLAAPP
jgi:hypothetical protein